MEIRKDYRPVWWSLVWSYLLLWVPTIVMGAAASSVKYEVTAGGFVARSGIFIKRAEVVELYRIKNLASVESAFGGGRVIIVNSDGSSHTYKYIREPDRVVLALREQIATSREDKKMSYRENI